MSILTQEEEKIILSLLPFADDRKVAAGHCKALRAQVAELREALLLFSDDRLCSYNRTNDYCVIHGQSKRCVFDIANEALARHKEAGR